MIEQLDVGCVVELVDVDVGCVGEQVDVDARVDVLLPQLLR